MKRAIATLMTVMSLALCVCTGLMFVLHAAELSHRTEGGWYFDFRDRPLGGFQMDVAWPDGELVVDGNLKPIEPFATAAAVPTPPTRSIVWGFMVERGRYPIDVKALIAHGVSPSEMNLMARPHAYSRVIIPRWLMGAMAVAAAIPPAIWAARFRRRRLLAHRQKAGLCMHCGYDLRASKERCPECGTLRTGPAFSENDPAAGRPAS